MSEQDAATSALAPVLPAVLGTNTSVMLPWGILFGQASPFWRRMKSLPPPKKKPFTHVTQCPPPLSCLSLLLQFIPQEIQDDDVKRSVQLLFGLLLWAVPLRLWWQLCRLMHNMCQQLWQWQVQVRLLRAQRRLLCDLWYMQPWLRAYRLQLPQRWHLLLLRFWVRCLCARFCYCLGS